MATSYISNISKIELKKFKKVYIYLKARDLMIFDFRLFHGSTINTSNNVKTIISFNTNFDDYIGDNNV